MPSSGAFTRRGMRAKRTARIAELGDVLVRRLGPTAYCFWEDSIRDANDGLRFPEPWRQSGRGCVVDRMLGSREGDRRGIPTHDWS
jgi:hypothetical protein